MCDSLSDLAFNQAVESFNEAPFHPEERLKRDVAAQFFASLSNGVAPNVLAVFINNDDYFKRVCQSRGISIKEQCYCYKELFFEQYIQELVVSYSNNNELLIEQIGCIADYIHKLHLDSIAHGFPIDLLCSHLPNLSKLELTFSKSEGDQFQRFGKAIASSPFLTSLVLKDTYIADYDIPVIFEWDQSNLTHLDLSHNRISSVGAEILVDKFVTPTSVLSHLDLSGNKICHLGAAKIGAALVDNESLVSLNLGLNKLEDQGGVNLFQCIAQNSNLKVVNVSADKLGAETASVIVQLVAPKATSIESLVLTSNSFSDDDLARLCQHDICLVAPSSKESTSDNDISCLASEVPS
jgi:Leucine-rich repeat (LRR) protein